MLVLCAVNSRSMTTLSEIEAAAEALPADQKRQLLLFLAERLRAERAPLPQPRRFGRRQIDQWVADDEADGKRFREGG
jgi:hypothetical protein